MLKMKNPNLNIIAKKLVRNRTYSKGFCPYICRKEGGNENQMKILEIIEPKYNEQGIHLLFEIWRLS